MQTEDILSATAPSEALLRIAIAMVDEPAMWKMLLRSPASSAAVFVRSAVTRFNAIGSDYSFRQSKVIPVLRAFHGMNIVRIGTHFGTCWTEVAWKRFVAIR